MQARSKSKQAGVSLSGLIMVLVVLGVIAAFGLKLFPTVTEYMAAKKAISYAKGAGATPSEIRTSFDKQADINNIKTITGKDLEIERVGEAWVVGFSYEKRLPLVGPASLVIDYTASTSPDGKVKAK
ncbi:DUF4845 domain-containing protein [Lacisediminimonas sp.]|uniref:DUF4845 domain-containing protein n=1 Tax=Lacisediminimonas sp. TaxID=3060582 RepID=UPI00271CB749|nr:DUF4845 domain-containing protein [Lacisediminimonas sp.]MDO8301377.1 DUF4845 domain-containing protein [Lacisediminimonas sp.]MDO9216304.1 DUF4845 domain-containing protein [Lacisediminimonas sp.]